jgi:hypothetical protein
MLQGPMPGWEVGEEDSKRTMLRENSFLGSWTHVSNLLAQKSGIENPQLCKQ